MPNDDIEQERRRLAQRLQQDILQPLQMLQAQTELYTQTIHSSPQAHMALNVLLALTQQAVQRARYLQQNLDPSPLETLGLEPALEAWASDELRIRGIQIQIRSQRLRERLPTAFEYVLFRALQSLVDWALETAQANRFELTLQTQDSQVSLRYRDNGIWEDLPPVLLHPLRQSVQEQGGSLHAERHEGGLQVEFLLRLHQTPTLTPRELEIMQALAEGQSNKEIAQALHLSARTVNFHLDNVYQKLGVNTRTEAVLIAVQQGWVRPSVK